MGEPAGSTPIVERLADVAVDAVVGLTRTLARLNERRAGSADRAADFRTLARWFSTCPSEEAAHRVWQAAFGLYSARHFHLEEDDAERTGPGISWWEAEPAPVPVRLRTHGGTSNAGRPSPAADHGRQKEWMAERHRRERAQIEAASRRFAGQGAMRLSDIAGLEAAEFELLLALLDEVLNAEREPCQPATGTNDRAED
jgi:uncharacterized protein (TIGR02677 family)